MRERNWANASWRIRSGHGTSKCGKNGMFPNEEPGGAQSTRQVVAQTCRNVGGCQKSRPQSSHDESFLHSGII